MDKRDIQSFFSNMKTSNDIVDENALELFDNCEISKLDINRMYRYLDKCIQTPSSIEEMGIIDTIY